MLTVFRSIGSSGSCGWAPDGELPGSAAAVTGDDVCWVDLADPTPEAKRRGGAGLVGPRGED